MSLRYNLDAERELLDEVPRAGLPRVTSSPAYNMSV